MLAKLAEELPPEGAFLYEPKWDGFRAIVFRGGSDVYIQSRDLRPLDRYFPELHDIFLERLPDGWVIDGTYRRKLGNLVLENADTVVWLDLPMRVWFPRLLRRTLRRVRGRELLWNDNTESLRGAFWGRRIAVRLGPPDALRAQAPLSRRAGAVQRRAAPLAARGRAVALDRSQVTDCYLAFERRERHSAAHASARRPSQIGVSNT